MAIIAAIVIAGIIYFAIVQTILWPMVLWLYELVTTPYQRDGGDARLYNSVIGVILIAVGEATSGVVTGIGIVLVALMVLLTLRFYLWRLKR